MITASGNLSREWDAGLKRLESNGPFVAGRTGTMILAGQAPLVTPLLGWVEPGQGYQDKPPIPSAAVVVRVRHSLEPLRQGGTPITHVLTIDGPAADEMGPTVGVQISADSPRTLAALAQCAAALRRQ